MAEQWYYRFMDQEMGPVDLSTLRALAADGALATSDEVRRGADGEWLPAESVAGLFPEAADAGDLMNMLEIESASAVDAPARGARGSTCYCRLLGVEMGPMSFDQLAALASAGRLNPQDEVRLDARAEWIEAGSIVGLFPSPESNAAAPEVEAESSLGVDDLLGSHELEFAPAAAAGPAVRASPAVVEDGTRVWYCKVLGHEIGPMTFEEVHAMITDGQLSRTDELRHGRRGDWMPADSIVGLFPDEESPAAVDELPPDDDEPDDEAPDEDEDGYKFDFADFVGDEAAAAKPQRSPAHKRDRRKQRGGSSRPTPERTRPAVPRDEKPARTSPVAEEPAPRERPTPAPLSPPTPRPSPVPPAPYSPPAGVRPAVPSPSARPAPVAAPRPRRAIGNPFAGLGSAIGGVFRSVGGLFGSLGGGGGLAQQWKPLAAVVVLGAIAYLIYFGSPFSSSRAPDIYRETLVIWEEAQRLKESPGEWTPFRDKSLPRVQQLGTELVQEASSKDRLMQLMLYCHRDCLPLILQGPDTAGPKWDEMKDYMEEAKRYMPAE